MSQNVRLCIQVIIIIINKFSYEINGQVLDKVLVEKDLGIMISSDVKSSQQCVAACNKATSYKKQ